MKGMSPASVFHSPPEMFAWRVRIESGEGDGTNEAVEIML